MTSIRSGDASFASVMSGTATTAAPTSPTNNAGSSSSAVGNLEHLLFKATNPSNKLEDVNTIKQFCDAVNAHQEGPVIACRLLAHKIQSPQEREAVQALAVLEACVKSCGPAFHTEVGKFRFLNEMIKLVSSRYLADRTPEHIKKKVIEMLFVWTRGDLKHETKIAEAYQMLKTQGIVKEDPIHVGEAVFASALPRQKEPLSEEDTKKLRKLLQSKNPEDLQKANKIIKGMVQEDERKLDAMSRRHTELTMVKNNSKLLNEMLDHYDKNSSGQPELELLKELFDSCEKMQPKLFRLAAEATDESEGKDEEDKDILEILQASDDITKVIERYKRVIVEGKTDVTKKLLEKQNSELLLDLDLNAKEANNCSILDQPKEEEVAVEASLLGDPVEAPKLLPSIDDLLMEGSDANAALATAPSLVSNVQLASPAGSLSNPPEKEKSSRQRGLEELDFLGESAIKSHLPKGQSKSPQFAKKSEKMSLNSLQEKKRQIELASLSTVPPAVFNGATTAKSTAKSDDGTSNSSSDVAILNDVASTPNDAPATKQVVTDVKVADLNVPLASIKPGNIPPMTVSDGSDEGISIVLHFGKEQPRESVSAIVVTIISKMAVPVSDFELKAVVPKGCKVKLQPPSAKEMPAHNPFVPPSAITQVMLIANPQNKPVSLKYVLSYLVDGEPQTEMGEVEKLPI